jgi:hypothetical protein
MTSGNAQDLQDLFNNAQDEGLSQATTGILVNNLNGTTVAGAQGTAADDLTGDEVTLFVEILDRTGSMSPWRQAVIDSFNEQLTALGNSKAADSILMSSWLFNEKSTLRHGYLPLANVPTLDLSSYDPDGSTALYDAVLDALTGVVAYGQSLRDAGIRTKIVVVAVTDGEDNASRRATPAKVKTVVEDLLRQEIYTFAFVAFGMSGKQVADSMGFPAQNVLDANADPSSIRKALGTVSKSVIRASQTVIGATGSGSFFS